MEASKRCNECGEAKPLDEFYKNRSTRLNQCKECVRADRKEYRAKNPEVIKATRARNYNAELKSASSKKYYAKNAERLNEYNRRYYAKTADTRKAQQKQYRTENCEWLKEKSAKYAAANPGLISQRGKLRYAKNSETIKKKVSTYRAKYPDKHRERSKRWAVNNPDKVRTFHLRRRANKVRAEGSHTVAEWRALVARFEGRCVCCRKHFGLKKLTLDHVVPLARGGSDYISNAQPLCGPCNSRKGNRHATDYRKTYAPVDGGSGSGTNEAA